MSRPNNRTPKPAKKLPVLTEDQKRLAADHYHMAVGLATKVARKPHWYNHWDEIVSEATHALVWAAHSFDPSKGFRFSTYATSCINWTIVRITSKIASERTVSSLDEDERCDPPSDRDDFRDAEDREQVEQFLGVLPTLEADAVRKVCLEGWSPAEYAAEVGVSRVTIHKRKVRGLEAMRHVACSV